MVSSIFEKIASAVDAEVRRMSKNLVVTQPLLVSKILTVNGFIFCNAVSFDPSVANEYGLCFIICISDACDSLAKAPFSIQAVFVQAHEYIFAIWLSGNIFLNVGL